MKNLTLNNHTHREIFTRQTLTNAQADVDESLRQMQRAISKLLALSGTKGIRADLLKSYKALSEIEGDIMALSMSDSDLLGKIIDFPTTKAEGFELGLFSEE